MGQDLIKRREQVMDRADRALDAAAEPRICERNALDLGVHVPAYMDFPSECPRLDHRPGGDTDFV